MKDVGKPCKREAYARIDGGRLETERRPRSPRWHRPAGNRGNTGLRTYRRSPPPRQSPTLHGAFYRTELHALLRRINAYLVRWIRRKYKRLAGFKKAKACWRGITTRYPRMFAHWQWTAVFW